MDKPGNEGLFNTRLMDQYATKEGCNTTSATKTMDSVLKLI